MKLRHIIIIVVILMSITFFLGRYSNKSTPIDPIDYEYIQDSINTIKDNEIAQIERQLETVKKESKKYQLQAKQNKKRLIKKGIYYENKINSLTTISNDSAYQYVADRFGY